MTRLPIKLFIERLPACLQGVISPEVGAAGWRLQLPRVMMPPPERWPITTMGQSSPLAAKESRRKGQAGGHGPLPRAD